MNSPEKNSFRHWTGEWIAGKLGTSQVQRGALDSKNAQSRIFDLASLSKVLLTSTLLVDFLLDTQKLPRLKGTEQPDWERLLAFPLSKEIPELKGSALEKLSLIELWEHRSGLRPHVDIFGDQLRALSSSSIESLKREEQWATIIETLKQENLGAQETQYSDLGFLLLGLWLERRQGRALDELWREWKQRQGLNPKQLVFSKELEHRSSVLPTERRHETGRVNDDNAAGLGGVAPHAGLWASIDELWSYLEHLLAWSQQEALVRAWCHRKASSRFVLGWDTPSREPGTQSQAGRNAPPLVRGHLGFTGTAFWWDPESLLAGVLLTNRVYPSHSSDSQAQIRRLRTEFFSQLWQNENLGERTWINKANLPPRAAKP